MLVGALNGKKGHMKTLLITAMLLTSYASFAKDRILFNFTDESKAAFIKNGIFKNEDFQAKQIEVLESTTFDIVSTTVQTKFSPTECYEGNLKIIENIFQKLIKNSETKYGRTFDSKDVKIVDNTLLASLNANYEDGCGIDGRPVCWNFTVTIPPCGN